MLSEPPKEPRAARSALKQSRQAAIVPVPVTINVVKHQVATLPAIHRARVEAGAAVL